MSTVATATVAASALAGAQAPCIRCGDCADACPRGLAPQLLLLALRAGRDDRLAAAGLAACDGCARCDAVCPTRIPLAALLQAAQADAGEADAARRRADAARERYLARGRRLQRVSDEAEARQATRQATNTSADAVAAALARARARRGGGESP